MSGSRSRYNIAALLFIVTGQTTDEHSALVTSTGTDDVKVMARTEEDAKAVRDSLLAWGYTDVRITRGTK